ncbi:MAG TPA: hypothetical protein VGO09_11760, partial [Flavisolibacter sp.]|nr:hypothetical protein [Flavisolibacter sp.]
MLYINDDMDELIRRAAEEYPLNTSGADWDRVKKGLASGSVQKKSKKGWLLILPLLIFWISNTFIAYQEGYKNGKAVLNSTEKKLNTNNSKTTGTINPHSNNIREASNNIPGEIKLRTSPDVLIDINTIKHPLLSKNENTTFISPDRNKTKQIIKSGFESTSKQILSENPYSPNRFDFIDYSHNPQLITILPLSITNRNNIAKTDIKTATNKKERNSKGNFYAAFLLGTDLSTVKLQTLSKPGISSGIKLGYNFTGKWSVETGVLYSIKSYYSDGKYFNYKVNPSIKIKNVDGVCHMFEIPLDVKFKFAQIKNHSFYTSVGMSSYLMKKEDYNYDYDWYGQPYYANKTYTNSTNNLFSIININFGYQHKLGKT